MFESIKPEDGEREIENPSIDRYTAIRDYPINTSECGADFITNTQLGIRVLTDSEKLAAEIGLTAGDLDKPKSDIDFVYLTKKSIDPVEDSEIPPRPISKGVLGDLVVDKSLTQYGLAGPDKFGSMESVLFGIYSFERAKQGFLGIHAAQIFDRKKNLSHILIGNSGIGKSTLAQFLETIQPDRFEVIADDWVEIDHDQKRVRPISTTFGTTKGTLNNDLVISNNRADNSFDSFGKTFYTHDTSGDTIETLGAIIQLSNPNHESSKEGVVSDFIELNRHIPFLTQIDKEVDFLPTIVRSRLKSILDDYIRLRKHRAFSVLTLDESDINKKIGKLLKALD